MLNYADIVISRHANAPKRDQRILLSLRIGALVVVFLWGVYQCFWNLAARNRGGDEVTYVAAAWQYVHGDFHFNREHPPTGRYLLGVAQLIGGPGELAPRAFIALIIVAGAAIIFWWLRQEVGWWGALTAAGLWMLIPRRTPGDDGLRIDRSAILDPIMVFFAIAAVATVWRWIRTERWWWIAASGVLMAASVTSKVSTVVLLPVFLLLPILFAKWRTLLIGGLIWLGSFLVAAVALYAPVDAPAGIRYMLDFQHEHDVNGHLVDVAGSVHTHPPWWASLWFTVQGMGLPLTVVLCLAIVCAVSVRPDRLVLVLVAALGLELAFLLGYAEVALPYYYYDWVWLLALLAAIGFTRLSRLRPQALTWPVSVAAVLIMALLSAPLSGTIWRAHPEGIARVPALLKRLAPRGGDVLIAEMSPSVYDSYVPTATMDDTSGPFSAIVVGTDDRFPLSPQATTLITTYRSEFTVRQFDDITVWIPDRLITARSGGLQIAGDSSAG